MSASEESASGSPWRTIFEKVRQACGGKRDEHGVVGSINWLRKEMARRGANPNVVRNIIYRDKGKLGDKRVLFGIFSELWEGAGNAALEAPGFEVLLSASGTAEQEVAQLLGRDKRRAYRAFVSAVRSQQHPKLLIAGKPGSGKTVLMDYIQQALEAPPHAEALVRLEFSNPDLGISLGHLAATLGIAEEVYEARLLKVGLSSAYAVQADAQADVARLFVETLRRRHESRVLLLHISQSLGAQNTLGSAPLRLNTEEVPRVTAAEWLWLSLIEPLSKIERLSLLVTMAEAPPRVLEAIGSFEGPVKLAPPTVSEARRFVQVKLPQASGKLQEDIVRQAGRSLEDLRILTLLAELREEGAQQESDNPLGRLERLSNLVETAEDPALRDFLGALAVLSLPEFPSFGSAALIAMGQLDWQDPHSLARTFLDVAPHASGESQWRCFSRQLGRALRQYLAKHDPERYRALHLKASRFYEPEALLSPEGEAAARFLEHLFEARDWQELQRWISRHNARRALIRQVWQAARQELKGGPDLESIALEVARYYVRLMCYDHPEAQMAFSLLSRSLNLDLQAWTRLKQAEGAIVKGHYEEAEALLAAWPDVSDPLLRADYELAKATIARWRGQLALAAQHVAGGAAPLLREVALEHPRRTLLEAKVAIWSGLIAKDEGKLEEALAHFGRVVTSDALMCARQAFQKGDTEARLGHFDTAVRELSLALDFAEESEAPATEQARYLARRARILRKRSEPSLAERDFADALQALNRSQDQGHSPLELAFERAKLEDEHALNLLALGQAEGAILLLQENLATFTRFEQHYPVDASFRILRSRLRLSLAYWIRGLGAPYSLPLLRLEPLGQADTQHAESLILSVKDDIEKDPRGRERYGPLYTKALLVLSLLARNEDLAIKSAGAALEAAQFPYESALHGAHLAAASLRFGHAQRALAAAEAAQQAHARVSREGERGDLGLLAWLACLGIQAELKAPLGFRGAADKLLQALAKAELDPYAEVVLRCFGEALTPWQDGLAAEWAAHCGLKRALGAKLPQEPHLRLPDALILRWQQREVWRDAVSVS